MLLVLGLDGADWRVLEPWLADGTMPTLAGLRARGLWGPLTSTIRPESSIAWATFATGVNAGKHGVFGFVGQRPDSYEVTLNTAASVRAVPFWQRAAAAGRRVAVVNVPMTYPPRPIPQGVLVAGMLTPDIRSPFTQPPSLQAELLRAVPDYVIQVDRMGMGLEAFVRATTEALRARARAGVWLLEREAWDVMVLVFTATDRLQHYTMHLLYPEHPRYDAEEARRLLPVLKEAYRALDEGIAMLLEKAGPDATVMVLSDHGFSPVARAFLTNVWLQEQGLLVMREGAGTKQDVWARLRRVAWLRRWKQRLPGVRRVRRRASLAPFLERVDWSRTRAVYSPTGGIRLNVRGREPMGVLSRQEADALAAWLQEALPAERDPLTGAHPITHVYPREALYAGPWVAHAPDLILTSLREGEHPGHHVQIPPRMGPQVMVDSGELTGNHAYEGIVLVYGPGITQGRIEGAHLMDLAPTILQWLEVPVPQEMDGRVLAFAGEEGERVGDEVAMMGEEVSGLSEEDQRTLEERLRSLGYL